MRSFLILLASFVLAEPAIAQKVPPEYAAVLKTLARHGDYKDGVLEVNTPRNAEKLASAFRAAVDQTGNHSSARR